MHYKPIGKIHEGETWLQENNLTTGIGIVVNSKVPVHNIPYFKQTTYIE
ncbi:MAG: hypothetical protein PHZ11_09100 [Desulfitobacteriaceae bacterium]|nr:hypothetical protein [Desulfitobacteriaceae bacterium]MDD4347019.1 hypothetical protein [Desulfitobacteriaceae bacterium]MDD4402091.1 hypothetical protein [Desulfitobacteriaceae bacterium]